MATQIPAASGRVIAKPKQNWVLGPLPDLVFIIATPILTFALVASVYPLLGMVTIWMLFMIYTMAHHLPGFFRIYGDRDLVRRFKFKFLFGPLIPAAFATGLYIYSLRSGLSIETISFIFLVPVLWDVWHFLMQHYGFMRIYDRPNAAPRLLASRMDMAICWSWFIFIMVRSGSWLPDLLDEFYESFAIPLLHVVSLESYQLLNDLTWVAALLATICYAGYMIWCWTKGYFVSPAKLLLLGITFGVMYLTYVPNAIIDPLIARWHGVLGFAAAEPNDWHQRNALRWNFYLGFLVLGLVHNTQYLAIVWKYNRSLAQRDVAKPPTPFLVMFARGGVVMLLIYVALCMAYGSLGYLDVFVNGPQWLTQFIVGFVYVLGFTSVMMHYYTDGFIWKVRHKENQANLSMLDTVEGAQNNEQLSSWWTRYRAGRLHSATVTALQLTLYFGVPLGVVTFLALNQKSDPWAYKDHMRSVLTHYNAGRIDDAIREAERAADLAQERLTVLRRLVELDPNAPHHYNKLAEFIYIQATAEKTIADLRELGTIEDRKKAYESRVMEAIETLKTALQCPRPLNSDPRSQQPDIPGQIAQWQQELGIEPD